MTADLPAGTGRAREWALDAPWLLQHPLDSAGMALDPAYRRTLPQPDGKLLVAILAVDR